MMRVFHWCVLVLCSRRVRDTQCGFKLFTRKVCYVTSKDNQSIPHTHSLVLVVCSVGQRSASFGANNTI
jgi:hypothetical protein